jgi:hypothetical protein
MINYIWFKNQRAVLMGYLSQYKRFGYDVYLAQHQINYYNDLAKKYGDVK